MDNGSIYSIRVPENDEIIKKSRRKGGLIAGIAFFVVALFPAGILLGARLSGEDIGAGLFWFMIVLAVFLLSMGIWVLVSACSVGINYANSYYIFDFFADSMTIKFQDDKKNKTSQLENCLYRDFANKQYLHKVIEKPDRLLFKIYTGTYNNSPQYTTRILPKKYIKQDENGLSVKDFLKSVLNDRYKVENK